MYRFFMQRRYVELFFMIPKHKTIRDLSKKSGMTISHLSTVTDQWRSEGLIDKKRKGREVDLSITDKGKEFMELLTKYDELATRTKLEEDKNGEREQKGTEQD